jgi:hypothetical protein
VVVTDIGEYINQHSCERSFKLRLNQAEIARRYPFYATARGPLNPILATRGREREAELEATLGERLRLLNPGSEGNGRITWDEFVNLLGGVGIGEEAFAREVEIERPVGEFVLSGRMDFVVLRWNDGTPCLRIIECKASRRDKTYHRVQLAAYRTMVRDILDEGGLTIGGRGFATIVLESVVARIDEESNEVQDALSLLSQDLEEEMGDLRNLLAADGPLARVAAEDIDELSYTLDGKCGSCVHCPICLPESARLRKLELLGLDATIVRTLRSTGVVDLDALADLDLHGPEARALRGTTGFTADLDDLAVRAKARRSTLHNRKQGDWEVMGKRHTGPGLLPAHGDNSPLVRVFLDIEYDYLEDRLVGLAAHVTDSDSTLLTSRRADRTPDPVVWEKDGERIVLPNAHETVRIITAPWTGDIAQDDASEGVMIGEFFNSLVDAIVEVGGTGWRPVHFYIWSQGDMAHLIDACSRAGGPLLHHLTELLGCRAECQADLEQMIFTPLADEIERKVLLGYTGRSPVIATSLSWFGYPRFHWTRMVGDEAVDLSKVLRRDIFDFRTALHVDEQGNWCDHDDDCAVLGFYEIRAQFSSDVSSPYWYAMWGTLPEPRGRDNLLPRALNEYRRGGTGPLITSFLLAKCQALRWLEERMFQTSSISKPMVPLGELRSLGMRFQSRYDVVSASLDFLRLDHHVKKMEWLVDSMRSPAARVADGSTLPLREVFPIEEGSNNLIGATVDLERFGIDPRLFFSSCTIEEGAFVRVAPYSGDVITGQGYKDLMSGGVTAHVEVLDPVHGAFKAAVIPSPGPRSAKSRYLLPSFPSSAERMTEALVGESLANFARSRVDVWLDDHRASPIAGWFDPRWPSIPLRTPLPATNHKRYGEVLRAMKARGRNLDEVQVMACLEGLGSTVQLLLGPPGTGKTNTAAAAVLLRLAAKPKKKLFLLSANTHTAVDELTTRIREILPDFRRAADLAGLKYNVPIILRLTSEDLDSGERVGTRNTGRINEERGQGDVVLCGTINEVLKVAEAFGHNDLRADGLIIDEASMMVFADFLALATLVADDGEIMLAGDHMQLAPITSHDWDNETREQIVSLAPHQSAYRAVNGLVTKAPQGTIVRSALDITYRLTPELTHLISGVYLDEGVILRSMKGQQRKKGGISSFEDLWNNPGVFLVVHDEASSRRSNAFEARLIHDIIQARGVQEHEVQPRTVSVITPHRAQRGMLKHELSEFEYHLKLVDTVERLQGGECETIFVSGTQSDTGAITTNAEFILDLNRTNVIFSRAQERLVVVCSRNLLDSMPADIDDYASAWLWKHLRSVCDTVALDVPGYEHRVEVRVPGRFWR